MKSICIKHQNFRGAGTVTEKIITGMISRTGIKRIPVFTVIHIKI